MKKQLLRCRLSVLLLVFVGCARVRHADDSEVRLSQSDNRSNFITATTPGDYALYYGPMSKPEVPVRVKVGDRIGFVRESDGRIKGVAGPFRIDIDPGARDVRWKQLSSLPE